jgi:hypothetical protein
LQQFSSSSRQIRWRKQKDDDLTTAVGVQCKRFAWRTKNSDIRLTFLLIKSSKRLSTLWRHRRPIHSTGLKAGKSFASIFLADEKHMLHRRQHSKCQHISV